MRFLLPFPSALTICTLALLAACERQSETAPPAAPVEPVSAYVSDELPALGAVATGIAFWDHPTLSFNSIMIVASENGLVSYNMEDGNEVARIDGVKAQGAATSYLGLGRQAAGFVALFDTKNSAFRFYGVDNTTRLFLPLDGGPQISGDVRGFCLGRAADAAAPSLYVIQPSKLHAFNLAASANGVAISNDAVIPTPDDIVACTVDAEGVILAAAKNGAIYALAGEKTFTHPLAKASMTAPGDLVTIATRLTITQTPKTNENEDAALTQLREHILWLDKATGALHAFNRADGAVLGVVNIAATDNLPGVDHAEVFGASGANLGALYRNGIMAYGVSDGTEGPVIRLSPGNSLMNALSLPLGEPLSPRGETATQREDNGLSIGTGFQPE